MEIINFIYRLINQLWINPILTIRFIKWLPKVIKEYTKFKKLNNKYLFPIKNKYFITNDLYEQWWIATWHYFHQDLLVAQEIYIKNPTKHVDIWSRVDWLISNIASFRDIEVFDIREIKSKIKNIKFKKANLMYLNNKYINYCDSISSLHAIEHFWLWRYWDPIDPEWHIKWLNNIYKILKKWWIFYFSVPIWEQRVEFNAHRVFNLKYLIDFFYKKYNIINFSYVDDKWNLHKNIKLSNENIKKNYWCNYWCGIFKLLKL